MPTKIEDIWKIGLPNAKNQYIRTAIIMSLTERDDWAIMVYDMTKRIEELEWKLKRAEQRRNW